MIAADLAASLIARLADRGFAVTTAESCTGGMIGAALTDIAGSSSVYREGVITYANEAKARYLDVPEEILARHGAVSAEVAGAMADGALARSGADLSLAVTGIAGPGGGTPDKPVGLVYIGAKGPKGLAVTKHLFPGSTRAVIRHLTVRAALRAGLDQL